MPFRGIVDRLDEEGDGLVVTDYKSGKAPSARFRRGRLDQVLLYAAAVEQATGEKLNELTELYYKEHPRSFDDVWPQEKYLPTDSKLRRILTEEIEAPPKEVVRMAKEEMQIVLE